MYSDVVLVHSTGTTWSTGNAYCGMDMLDIKWLQEAVLVLFLHLIHLQFAFESLNLFVFSLWITICLLQVQNTRGVLHITISQPITMTSNKFPLMLHRVHLFSFFLTSCRNLINLVKKFSSKYEMQTNRLLCVFMCIIEDEFICSSMAFFLCFQKNPA